jgi:2-iminoacetate synthase ThiH
MPNIDEYDFADYEPTDEQIDRLNPNFETDQHRRRIAETNARIIAQGRTPTLRDTYDPRFDGPW